MNEQLNFSDLRDAVKRDKFIGECLARPTKGWNDLSGYVGYIATNLVELAGYDSSDADVEAATTVFSDIHRWMGEYGTPERHDGLLRIKRIVEDKYEVNQHVPHASEEPLVSAFFAELKAHFPASSDDRSGPW